VSERDWPAVISAASIASNTSSMLVSDIKSVRFLSAERREGVITAMPRVKRSEHVHHKLYEFTNCQLYPNYMTRATLGDVFRGCILIPPALFSAKIESEETKYIPSDVNLQPDLPFVMT
jgi:hypothetical protein